MVGIFLYSIVKTRQFVESSSTGDRKPSQFPSAVPEPLTSVLWFRRLPSDFQPIIATMDAQPLQTVANGCRIYLHIPLQQEKHISAASSTIVKLTRKAARVDTHS